MLEKDFRSNCQDYEGFQVWEVENLDAFFAGNKILTTIFEDEYKMTVTELSEKRSEITDTDIEVIKKMLDLVGDKSFYVFTLHDPYHLELVGMQDTKVMDFGTDIGKIKGDFVYVMIMDKKEVKMG